MNIPYTKNVDISTQEWVKLYRINPTEQVERKNGENMNCTENFELIKASVIFVNPLISKLLMLTTLL